MESDVSLKIRSMIPRRKNQKTSESLIFPKRLAWLEERTGVDVQSLRSTIIPSEVAGCFVENFIGTAQIPVGLSGPIRVCGQHANGTFYVPFATTESTLVQSYQQGMIALTRSGGVSVRIDQDEIHISPVFIFKNGDDASKFSKWVSNSFERIKSEAESTTKYGKLLRLNPISIGNRVIVQFFYSTGDAMGLNMIVIATEKASDYMRRQGKAEKFYLRCNFSSDKKASFLNFCNGYGKTVSAETIIPASVLKRVLGTSADSMSEFWINSVFGSMQAGMIGLNAQYANALAAIFIACGQDVASIVNSSTGFSWCEAKQDGSLYIALRIPTLVVGTVGGGTTLPTQKECLSIMGCVGTDKSKKFAEIIAATLLAGETSICAALARGNFSKTHLNARNERLRATGLC